MSNWKVVNAKSEVTATAATLEAAINQAPPGAVVVVDDVGPPIRLETSAQKAGYGVCVALPLEQEISADFIGASNLHFFGGLWVNSGSYGAELINATKISFNGSHVSGSKDGILGNAEDVLIRNCLFDTQSADHVHFGGSKRIAVTDNTFTSGAKGLKFCYFGDGRSPINGVGEDACLAQGGSWKDSSHNDIAQMRDGCESVSFLRNNISAYNAQGFVTFSDGPGGVINRLLVAENSWVDAHLWGIYAQGGDIEVRDNTIVGVGGNNSRIRVDRIGDGRIRGGRNVAPSFTNPTGVDFGASTINGDEGVLAPESPNIIFPPWAPQIPTPVSAPPAPPEWYTSGGILYIGTLAAGTWLSLNRGQWTDYQNATYEYRWRKNGVLISGATNQMWQAEAGTIVAECRGTNSIGTGEWHAYPAITVS